MKAAKQEIDLSEEKNRDNAFVEEKRRYGSYLRIRLDDDGKISITSHSWEDQAESPINKVPASPLRLARKLLESFNICVQPTNDCTAGHVDALCLLKFIS